MTLKDLVFAVRQGINSRLGSKLSVGHTYEMLAALMGYGSFASLSSQAFIISCGNGAIDVGDAQVAFGCQYSLERAAQRHRAIRAQGDAHATAAKLKEIAESLELVAIPHAALISLFEGGLDDCQADVLITFMECIQPDDAPTMAIALGMLEQECARKPALHYPISQIYQAMVDEEADKSDYWLKQRRAGRVLSEVEEIFANEAAGYKHVRDRYQYHYDCAVAGHNPYALIDAAADALGKRDLNAARAHLQLLKDSDSPYVVCETASVVVRSKLKDDCAYWAAKAAPLGHIKSMRWLVEQAEGTPTVDTWTWIYLSKMLGEDVTASNVRAYHDGGLYDGQEYDDDCGGPMCFDGDLGLNVRALDAAGDKAARHEARRLKAELKGPGRIG
ncbi:hypothetical protein HU761_23330 [Pseudomonas sp. SWRI59]|jgi:hypothetical protein|uniref:hypothetical protein n=1 Tax=Pseudomonas TaxID=286 RepID=UPI001645E537|nr:MULTISPECIES: hypothetical protein [unclassified Pseudomonas]MBC3504321.1 hypothetical protein [Pseudomonas sp. SWRI59]MBC3509588.1 hypothetical protein [Pseudomonas sp. SWRI68]MDD2062066.1 hypothetical protein [Pseudomonas sp. 25571]